MNWNHTIKTLAFASILALAPSQMMAAQKGGTFTTGDKTFLLNGKPFVVKAAELHYQLSYGTNSKADAKIVILFHIAKLSACFLTCIFTT